MIAEQIMILSKNLLVLESSSSLFATHSYVGMYGSILKPTLWQITFILRQNGSYLPTPTNGFKKHLKLKYTKYRYKTVLSYM